MQTAIDTFLLALRAAGRSPRTIVWYGNNLRTYAAYCAKHQCDWLSRDVPRAFIADLQTHTVRWQNCYYRPSIEGPLSPATIRGYVRTLRRFYRWCVDEELIPTDPSTRLVLPKLPRRTPRGITLEDLKKLFCVADARDRAILLLLLDTGMRVSELCALRDEDLDSDSIRVIGKGDQERFVFLVEETIKAVTAWRNTKTRDNNPHELLFSGLRGRDSEVGLTDSGVRSMLKRLAKQAGVTGKVNPHSFRHGFAREFLMNGGDLASLCDLLGHADITTTKIYATFTRAELKSKHALHSPVGSIHWPSLSE